MKFAITGNTDKREVLTYVPKVLSWLKKQNIAYCIEEELASALGQQQGSENIISVKAIGKCDIVLSLGGDGTILSLVRKMGQNSVPILGVKIGGLGFLTELTPEELFPSIKRILQGQYKILERMVLTAKVEGSGSEVFYALNDFVIDKGSPSRVIRLKTYIDDELLNTYIADGLIISTPTGSTAYSLSANGPILLPSIQAIIINPLNPHTLGARPVVIPDDKEIKIELEFATQEVILNADGEIATELQPGKAAIIKKAKHTVKMVSFKHRSFYDILRSKLNWGEDIRQAWNST